MANVFKGVFGNGATDVFNGVFGDDTDTSAPLDISYIYPLSSQSRVYELPELNRTFELAEQSRTWLMPELT